MHTLPAVADDTEVIRSEIVNNDTQKMGLDYAEEFSKNKLKQLEKIQSNISLAIQRKQEIDNYNHQDYINDTIYKNFIIKSHNSSILYAINHGVQFWKSHDSSNIYYRVNAFNKKKKLNVENDLFSLLGVHIKIYDNINDNKFLHTDNTLIIITSFLSFVKDEIFDPQSSIEWLNHNNVTYKNTFQYTNFLLKRHLLREKQQLEQQQQHATIPQLQQKYIQVLQQPQQEIQLLSPISSIQDQSIFPISLQDR
jgi:hypothetical protein